MMTQFRNRAGYVRVCVRTGTAKAEWVEVGAGAVGGGLGKWSGARSGGFGSAPGLSAGEQASEVEGDGGERPFGADGFEAPAAELAQIALLFEDAEDGFDESFAAGIVGAHG